ncbi:MAG: acyltransferase [Ruminococcus sp.]|nr:acyltransferase [Ruminococcus sp.]
MTKFSKDDTLAVKGIAILIMMQHHCFRNVSLFANYDVSFYPFSESLIVPISNFFKICVGMFVFLSAYGLTVSLKKYDSQYNLNSKQYTDYLNTRLVKLMWGYWFVFILSQILTLFIAPEHTMKYFRDGMFRGAYNIVVDFFGLSNLFGTASLNNTWWYMTLAVFIVLVVPFMAKALKKYNILFVSLVCLFLPRIINLTKDFRVGELANSYRWVFAILLGIIFAKYNLLPKLKDFMITNNKVLSKIIKFVIATAILVGFYMARTAFKGTYANYCFEISDGVIPTFVVYYCYEFIVGIPIIRQMLMFFGKHSMNIFLLHTFIRHYWFPEFTYSFRHFALISLVLFAVSLGASIVIEGIKKLIGYDKLLNFTVKKIEEKFGRSNKESVAE